MSKQGTINFTKKQIIYLLTKTGVTDPNEAIEIFAMAMRAENVDPIKILTYLNKMMAKDGVK